MTYFRDVYKKRGTWWGATSKDQYTNIAKTYFEDYLLNSPGAGTITLNNIEIAAAIHDDSKDGEVSRISKYFLFSLETEVSPGNLIFWGEEYWIVLQKEHRSFEAYNKVLAVKANYTLKWIDSYGILNETPCYLFGHMESRVQDNFKVANGIVVPQANKYLEIIIPYFPIQSEQRFIIRSEAWRVLERDLVSVNGILYMYLIEDLVDSFKDDITNSIAGVGNLNSAYVDLGLSTLTLGIGESFTFTPVLYKEGKVIDGAQFTYASPQDGYFISTSSNTITGLALGTATYTVASIDQPELTATCTITVLATGVEKIVLKLVGDNNIAWGRTRTYTAFYDTGGVPVEVAATFTLLNNSTNLVSFVSQDSTSCSIIANSEGLAGTVTLRATTAHGVIDKVISVVSVW